VQGLVFSTSPDVRKMPTMQIRTKFRNGGAHSRNRYTFDFVVDGLSLFEAMNVRDADLVGCLDSEDTRLNTGAVNKLLVKELPDIPPDRVMIYICPECGDLGCGAFTVRVTNEENQFVWSGFQYENSYDPSMTRRWEKLGPFHFVAEEYQRVLATAAPSRF
jgi:hypothetical protein